MENEFKYNDLIRVNWFYTYGREIQPYRFRNGPVPHITKCRWKKPRWKGDSLKSEACKLYIFDEDDGLTSHQKEMIRNTFTSRLSKKNFPDKWNDYPKQDYRDRSWKRYRKTRWK